MPKVELHLHLDGSVRVTTALELAAHRPGKQVSYFEMFDGLVPVPQLSSQRDLLKAFDLPVSLLQSEDSLARVTSELVSDKAADGVVYAEIRWAPQLHTLRGLDIPTVIECVASAAQESAVDSDTVVRLVVVGVRTHPPEINSEVAAAAVAAKSLGVVGFDIAGDEEAHRDLTEHIDACEAAVGGSLNLTVHAGELDDGGAGVWNALDLPVSRIAHGVSAAADPAVLDVIRERGIVLDMCPSSNVQAGSVGSMADHPAVALHRQGVLVTISTDDSTISDVSLSDEYFHLWRDGGATVQELWAMNRTAANASFCDEITRQGIGRRLDEWERLSMPTHSNVERRE